MLLKISHKLLSKFKGYCSCPEVIMMFVYMKARFSLSYRGLEEMMMIRGGQHRSFHITKVGKAFFIPYRCQGPRPEETRQWELAYG